MKFILHVLLFLVVQNASASLASVAILSGPSEFLVNLPDSPSGLSLAVVDSGFEPTVFELIPRDDEVTSARFAIQQFNLSDKDWSGVDVRITGGKFTDVPELPFPNSDDDFATVDPVTMEFASVFSRANSFAAIAYTLPIALTQPVQVTVTPRLVPEPSTILVGLALLPAVLRRGCS